MYNTVQKRQNGTSNRLDAACILLGTHPLYVSLRVLVLAATGSAGRVLLVQTARQAQLAVLFLDLFGGFLYGRIKLVMHPVSAPMARVFNTPGFGVVGRLKAEGTDHAALTLKPTHVQLRRMAAGTG